MPKAKCPSCGTIVTYQAGYSPICPTCGFGKGAAQPAQRPAAPAPAFSELPPEAPPAQPQNGLAIAALVCGIAGFLVGITAPVAIVLGIVALNQRVDSAGRAMAIAGIVLGAVLTIGFILILLFFAALFGSM